MRICLLLTLNTSHFLTFRTYLPDGIYNTTIDDSGSDWSDDDDYLDHRDPDYIALQPHPDDPPRPARPNKFPDITDKIEQTIDRFDAVIPKMNWSAPEDALWIHPLKQLSCTAVAHVLLLLKGSYIPDYEIRHKFDQCQPPSTIKDTPKPVLSLIREADINESREFRCFIINRVFVAICQRHCGNYFAGLATKENKARIKAALVPFINTIILPAFPLTNFVADVHLDGDLKKVTLIDLGVLSETDTDILLFDWDEMAVLKDRVSSNKMCGSSGGEGSGSSAVKGLEREKEKVEGKGEVEKGGAEGEEEEEMDEEEEEEEEGSEEGVFKPRKPLQTLEEFLAARVTSSSTPSRLPPTTHSLRTKPLPLFRCVTDSSSNLQPAFVRPGLIKAPDDAPEVLTPEGKYSTHKLILQRNKEFEERKAAKAAKEKLQQQPPNTQGTD